jgi:hypothetical protein
MALGDEALHGWLRIRHGIQRAAAGSRLAAREPWPLDLDIANVGAAHRDSGCGLPCGAPAEAGVAPCQVG